MSASGPVGGDQSAERAHFDLQRSALLRSVTHDLRTPLSAIRSIVTDLRDGVVFDDATRTDLLQTVCDEVDRMDRLVLNLLSMSRIEAGVLEPRHDSIDVDELARHRLAALAPLLRHVTVVVDIDDELPHVDGDFGQLEEVLTNLLANAARHAPGGSEISVRARRGAAPDREVVEVAVIDHGEGVPAAFRPQMFEAFQRGPGSRSTGVGLAVCKAIVEAHGGRIWCDDTPGGGATLCFTLPVRMGGHELQGDDA